MNNKHILITGGTGSFGGAVVKKLTSLFPELKITIFSRDEKKQDDMREIYQESNIRYFIGDVRDRHSLSDAMSDGVDFVFHAAALKQVPSCEFHPIESVRTNILGTENVLNAAIEFKVQKVICLSTDKAVYPVNAMGMTKALMEKTALSKARSSRTTEFCITRYGNVVGTRGSVVPKFIKQLLEKRMVTITNEQMTRFMMTLEDAVDLVLYAFNEGKNGDTFIMKSPAATVGSIVEATANMLGIDRYERKYIGLRHGEKMHEALLSDEEMGHSMDQGRFIKVPLDIRGLKYSEILDQGNQNINMLNPYDSEVADRLDIKGVIAIIKKSGLL